MPIENLDNIALMVADVWKVMHGGLFRERNSRELVDEDHYLYGVVRAQLAAEKGLTTPFVMRIKHIYHSITATRAPLWLRVLIGYGGKSHVYVLDLTARGTKRPHEHSYETIEAMPVWLQEKIAVLSMMEQEGPEHDIAGVGFRAADNVYWVEIHEGEKL